MWMYTKHGAFSCVKSRQEPLDGMQVRARHKEYLDDLLDAVDLDLPIISTPNSDYGFRVIARPKQWKIISKYLMNSIDYPDFKSHLHNTGFFKNGVEENYDIYTGAYNSYVRNTDSIYNY